MPNRKLFYKKAEFVRWDQTLEAALASSLQRLPGKRERTYADSLLDPELLDDGTDSGREHEAETRHGAEPHTVLCAMRYCVWQEGDTTSDPYLCGHALRYTPGVGAASFNLDSPGSEIELEALADKLPEGTNIAESVACFLVKENHVIVMPGGSLTAAHLSAYLNQLLKDTAVFQAGSEVVLRDYHHARGTGRLTGIQSVKVDMPFSRANTIAAAVSTTHSHGRWLRNVLNEAGNYWDSFGGDLSQRHVRQHERMSFQFKLKFGQGVRAGNDSVLDDLMSVVPEEAFQYISCDLQGYGNVKGNKLQLFRKRNIKYANNVPDANDYPRKLAEFLVALRSQRRIPGG